MASRNKGFIMLYSIALIGLSMTAVTLLSTAFVTKLRVTQSYSKDVQFENAFISAENWYRLNYIMQDKVMVKQQVLPYFINGVECEIMLIPFEDSHIEITIEGEGLGKSKLWHFSVTN